MSLMFEFPEMFIYYRGVHHVIDEDATIARCGASVDGIRRNNQFFGVVCGECVGCPKDIHISRLGAAILHEFLTNGEWRDRMLERWLNTKEADDEASTAERSR